MSDLEAQFKQVYGRLPDPIKLTDEESAASKKIPSNIASIADYFRNRQSARFSSSMHGLMRDEVYNYVNGQRSYYDIYRAVRAEAMAAGSWYYGIVTLKDVTTQLDAAVGTKALVLK